MNFIASADAARTGDAFAGIEIKIGVGVVLFLPQMRRLDLVSHITQANRTGLILQLTIAIRGAGQAIKRMVRDIKLHHAFAQFRQQRRLRADYHPGFDGGRAAGRRPFTTVDFNKAKSARTEAFHIVRGTQFGDRCPLFGSRAHHA